METDIVTAWEESNNALRDYMPKGDEIIFNAVHMERVRTLTLLANRFQLKLGS